MEPRVVWYLGEEPLHEAVAPTYPPIPALPSLGSLQLEAQFSHLHLGWDGQVLKSYRAFGA